MGSENNARQLEDLQVDELSDELPSISPQRFETPRKNL